MGNKILKLKFQGENFGYVKLTKGSDTFYGNGSEAEAVEFQLEKYKDSKTQFYFKVAGTKDSYLDFGIHFSSGTDDDDYIGEIGIYGIRAENLEEQEARLEREKEWREQNIGYQKKMERRRELENMEQVQEYMRLRGL